MKDTTKGTLAIILSAVIWGFGGVLLKTIYATGISVITVTFFSVAIGTLLVLLFNRKHINFKPKKQDLKWFLTVAVFGNLTGYSYLYAFKFTTVTNAVFLHYTMPIFAFLIAIFLLKEKITKWKFLALVISIIGISLVFNVKLISNGLDLTNWGNILAVISAVTYAMMIIATRRLQKESQFTIYFWNFSVSTVVAAFLLPHSYTLTSLTQLPLVLIYVILFSYLALLSFYYGARKIEASRTSIIMLLEVVITVLAAYFILNEVLTIPKIIGGLLILVSSLILILKQNHTN